MIDFIMCGINYLDMDEVASKIKRKSKDYALRWCIDNKVKVHKIGNKNMVCEYEFNIALSKPLVDYLKERYSKDWVDYYKAYDSEDITKYFTLGEKDHSSNTNDPMPDANNFLKDIGYGKP